MNFETILEEDGYNDGKAGRLPLPAHIFETPDDHAIYMKGYNAATKKLIALNDTFQYKIHCSGM